MKWFYLDNEDSVVGPATESAIRELYAENILKRGALIAAEGTEEWVPVEETITGLSSEASSIPSPPAVDTQQSSAPKNRLESKKPGVPTIDKKRMREVGLKAGEAGIKASAAAGSAAGTFASTGKLFTERFLRSDLLNQTLTKDEFEKLETANSPIDSTAVRNLLAWRRSLLWIAGLALILSSVLSLDHFVGSTGDNFPWIWWVTEGTQALSVFLAGVLALRGAVIWTNIKNTRRFARYSWICMFVVPFVIALIPITPFLDDRIYDSFLKGEIRVQLVIESFRTLTPLVFGLFSGVIRSSLTLKTMLPESPMPGWVAAILSPIFSLVYLIFLVASVQSEQLLLSVAFGGLLMGPLILTLNVRNLTRPVSHSGLEKGLNKARRASRLATTLGFVALLLFLVVNFEFVSDLQIGLLGVINFLLGLIASVLVITVASSDFLLSLFKSSFDREAELKSTPLYDDLNLRFIELDQLGLTELQAGEEELLKKVRGKRDE
ncbi:MAG: GYF domain-containing protein [Roseibacillus sp.]